MEILITVLAVIFGFSAFCLVGLILLQESKGGGIAAMGVPGMENLMGARNPLRKLTVAFAIIFLLLVLAIGALVNRQQDAVVPEGLAPAKDESAPAAGTAEAPPGTADAAPQAGGSSQTAAGIISPEEAKPAPETEAAPAAQPAADGAEPDEPEPKPEAGAEPEPEAEPAAKTPAEKEEKQPPAENAAEK